MKQLGIVFIILFSFSKAYSQSSLNESLYIDFKAIAVSRCNDQNEYYQAHEGISYSTMYGILTLKNIADTTLAFWMMSCSWSDHIKTKPSYIKLGGIECDSNAPKKVKLGPNMELILNSTIKIPKDIFEDAMSTNTNVPYPQYPTFRIGFLPIEESAFSFSEGTWFYEILDIKDIESEYIWTDPIPIRFYYFEWEIK